MGRVRRGTEDRAHRGGWAAVAALLVLPGCVPGIPRGGSPMPLSSGDCAAIPASVDQKVWTGGSAFGVTLTDVPWPGSGDWRDSAEHWCVHNNADDGIADFAMHVICGVESDLGKSAEFELERRTGYDGPTLRFNHGWAFITFQWPLIWMQNIDAGSIGTTAIARRTGDVVQTFLVRNALEIDTDILTTDCDTGLSIYSGSGYSTEQFGFEAGSGRDVVMCQHKKLTNSQYFAPDGTGSGSGFERDRWYFDVALDSGAIVVTPEDASDSVAVEAAVFLQEILSIAHDQEVYVVPINCPLMP